MNPSKLKTLCSATLFFAFFVILLGAYTRLTDAGLGCPDWPGCYGHWIAPKTSISGWTEMIHRYAAGTFACLLFALSIGFFIHGDKTEQRCIKFTLGIVLFQAALGMWTVTLKLLPIVVMCHLLGGLLLFGMLCYLRTRLSMHTLKQSVTPKWVRISLSLGIFLLLIQIALGGWVSTNYAGIACTGFPSCNGVFFPPFNFSEAFTLVHHFGENHQGGLLSISARMTIQMVHRLGALIVLIYWGVFGFIFLKTTASKPQKRLMILIFIAMILQIFLGMMNVFYQLPLGIAVAHNGIAALLFGLSLSLRSLLCK